MMYDASPSGIGDTARRQSRRWSPSWLMWLAVVSLTSICGIVGQMLYEARGELTIHAWTETRNIAEAIAQDVGRNMELLDLSLQALRDGVGDPRVMALEPQLRRAVLFDRAVTAKDLGTVFYLDDEARIVVESGAEPARSRRFGNSDFFHVHVHDGDRGLFISRPFLSPFDDEWSIALSRRVDRPGGNFGGAVVAIIKLAYFEKLFARIELGRNGTMALMRQDGTLLMRRPLDERDIGRVLDAAQLRAYVQASAAGPVEAVSKLDGVRRLLYVQPVADLPLVQVVGLAMDDLYAPWRYKLEVTAAALFVLCGTILGLVAFLQVELGRRARAEAAFASLAATDKLTGLPNRRRFDEILEQEWRRCGRAAQPLSMLMIDVDQFKAYNDAYGHLGGDAVLSAIGLCLDEALRRGGDFAARYGGEEFVVILPEQTADDAAVLAERIRTLVADLRQPHAASFKGIVSVSIGIACLRPQAAQGPSDLIEAADGALYAAKAGGRDRAVTWGPQLKAA